MTRQEIYNHINLERISQEEYHEEGFRNVDKNWKKDTYIPQSKDVAIKVLLSELGEYATAVMRESENNQIAELVQVAAVAVRMLEVFY